MTFLSLANINYFAILSGFAVICLIVSVLRLHVQYRAKQVLQEELAKRDNFALGISYACQISVIAFSVAYYFNDIRYISVIEQPYESALTLSLILAFICFGQYILSRI